MARTLYNIELPDELRRELDAIAALRGEHRATIIRQACREFIARHKAEYEIRRETTEEPAAQAA